MSFDAQHSFSGTRPVAPQRAVDLERLRAHLRGKLAGFDGDQRIEPCKGGQSNATFLLTGGRHRYVLRRKPPGALLPSAPAVDREFRVIRAPAATDVPVARAHLLCEDDGVIGSAFYVMDFVDGRMLWDPTLPDLAAADRAAHYDELNRVIAAVHRVDPEAVGLAEYGKAGPHIERQLARWTKQYRAAETERIDAADQLLGWLPRHIPAQAATRIVHGDYRLDNVIFHPAEPRILAVLDWELSTPGDPLADFAYHCLTWRLPQGAARGRAGVDLDALAIPTEADCLRRYLQRVGLTRDIVPQDWIYHLVFNMLRLVGTLQGVAARAVQGNASSNLAIETAKRARPLAEQAWALAQTINRH